MQSSVRKFFQPLVLVAVCLTSFYCWSPLQAYGDEEESVRVYKQLSPSVVSLSSAEGSGTGVLLNSTGTILTNAHVVTSPLPFKVQVDVVGPGDAKETLTYQNVKIIGYHPTLDLALIKIDTKENRGKILKSATLAKQKGSPGQRVYVIGNPAAGGQVLNKSITSGMLSAVDRQVEGAPYYQIDAAINPGNSGGPVCDRTGKVLGLVTFKFLDADAVGFAIPLHNIDQKSFVALSKRRSDPAKAQELLKMADKFSALSREAARVEGPEGKTRKIFDINAAVCYREALLYDASNPTVYYNVGTILRTLDADEIAIGYLTYSVQLAPWHDAKANAYRELGLALVKKGKEPAALAAWREGVAKFPYSAKVWEDLAVYHIQHNQPVDAAICASTALLVPEQDTRKDVMQQIVRDAMAAAGTSLNKINEETTDQALVVALDKLLAASNKARRDKKLYVNKDFEAVAKEFGGPPVEGVEKSIPAEPLARLPKLADIVAAADADGKAADKPANAPTANNDAGDDWIGSDGDKENSKPGAAAKSIVTGKSVVKKTREVVDAKVTDLEVGKVADVCWSNDKEAKYLFVLETDGLVRKIDVATWTEERQHNLATPCSSMAMSKAGLFVGAPQIQDVVLLDENTLERKARFPVSKVGTIASAPSLSHAYASADGGRFLAVLDGVTKKVKAQIASPNIVTLRGGPGNPGVGFGRFAITPDGKKMLCESSEQLHRLSIENLRLIYEGAGPRIGSNPQQVVVSPDSRYVALPSGGGNRDETHQGYFTFIYKISDLTKPVCFIDGGAYPRTMGFDFKAGLIYFQNFEKQLITFSPKGIKKKEYVLYGRGDEPDRLLVHPAGRKVLVKAAGGLAWVELPE